MRTKARVVFGLFIFAVLSSGSCSTEESDDSSDSGVSPDSGADSGTGCEPKAFTQCWSDDDVHWFDSCGNDNGLADDCPDQSGRCVDVSEKEAKCECTGHWQGDECNECPGNWDPDQGCDACNGNWDPEQDCGVCIEGWGGSNCAELCVRYVKAGAASGGDGLTWNSAFDSVQAGIDSAYDKSSSDPEFEACLVWVARGTYYTYISTWTDTLQLRPGVHLFGGFDGTEKSLEDRDWTENATVLHGGDGSGGENRVSTVVTGSNDAVIDGFTITSGEAWNKGGGMYNYRSSPIVTNCIFEANSASSCGGGGGMYNYHSSPTVSNCVFRGNRIIDDGCGEGGGGMLNESSSPIVFNCVFTGNGVESGAGGWLPPVGGGMYNVASSPEVTNCTFQGNFADEGGGMYNVGSSPAVTNCILWGNEPKGIYNGGGSSAVVTYSSLGSFFEGEGNLFSDPLFVNADPDKGPIDLSLRPGSPCIDSGDDEKAVETDIQGSPRVDVPDVGTPGTIADMGAFEYQVP